MTASYFILQSILIRGFAVRPTALDYAELYRPVPPAIARNLQFISTYQNQDYRDNYPGQSSLIDTEVLLTEYPIPPAIVSDDENYFTPLSSSKRNCHIIKCPKFVQSTYGTDGKKCYEFVNSCYLALISCMRHNAQLPRKQVDDTDRELH